MQPKREVTFVVRKLVNSMRRMHDQTALDNGHLTPMQGRIIGYVTMHCNVEVYQRDLEQEFHIRRSTATAILQTMERCGLISREPVARDARLKKLVLTQCAKDYHALFCSAMQQVEKLITQDVSNEELDVFFAVVEKFENNLERFAATQKINVQQNNLGEEHDD